MAVIPNAPEEALHKENTLVRLAYLIFFLQPRPFTYHGLPLSWTDVSFVVMVSISWRFYPFTKLPRFQPLAFCFYYTYFLHCAVGGLGGWVRRRILLLLNLFWNSGPR